MAPDRSFEGLLSGCVHSLAALVMWMPLASSAAAGCCNRPGWAIATATVAKQPMSLHYQALWLHFGTQTAPGLPLEQWLVEVC
jgi:hypothetical protein